MMESGKTRAVATGAVGMLLAAILTGCVSCPTDAVGLEQIIQEHNANAEAVPRLWSRAKVAVTFRLPGGLPFTWGSTSSLASPNGLLLYRPGQTAAAPDDFLLLVRETGQEVFRLGISAAEETYYFKINYGDNQGVWYGSTQLAGAPGLTGDIPLDPTQLVGVLGVDSLPGDLTRLPALWMDTRCDPEGPAPFYVKRNDAYVLTYIGRQPVTDRILFKRKMYYRWSDTEARRPFRTEFLDPNGNVVMVAEMSEYEAIELLDLQTEEPETPPMMPTKITIEWKGDRKAPAVSKIQIKLSKMTTEDRWDPEAATGFRSNLPKWPADKFHAVDSIYRVAPDGGNSR